MEVQEETKTSLCDDPFKRFHTTKGQGLVDLDFLGSDELEQDVD